MSSVLHISSLIKKSNIIFLWFPVSLITSPNSSLSSILPVQLNFFLKYFKILGKSKSSANPYTKVWYFLPVLLFTLIVILSVHSL